MSHFIGYFIEYQKFDRGRVMMGNNAMCRVIGLRLHDGTVLQIKQARHVLDLKRNLIYLGTFDQIGYIVKIELGNLRVINGSTIIVKGTRRNGVYVLDGQVIARESGVFIHSSIDKTMLWHIKIGHISERGLKELEKHGVLGGSIELCEDCVLGKSTRSSFNKSVQKSNVILDYVHFDL